MEESGPAQKLLFPIGELHYFYTNLKIITATTGF